MGIRIDCDVCGRELVYGREYKLGENRIVRCSACDGLLNLLLCLRTNAQYLVTLEIMLKGEEERVSLTKALQEHCKRLTDGLGVLLSVDELSL